MSAGNIANKLANNIANNNSEITVELTAEANMPTRHGDFLLRSYRTTQSNNRVAKAKPGAETSDGNPCLILCLSTGLDTEKTPMVRLHSACMTGEIFGSLRCECSQQLDLALAHIALHGSGALVYLDQEGRGIGIENKIRAYALQDRGLDTVDANIALGLPVDDRDFAPAAALLRALGIDCCSLLTNNPDKAAALAVAGIEVQQTVALLASQDHPACRHYLHTKKERMGHSL